jgi:predicted Zn-ribbon and HTH transcriptional regulator
MKPFEQPPSTYKIPGGSVTVGGPHLIMPIGNGKTVTFEMHSYWGVCPKTKNGDDMLRIPKAFYDAYDRWRQSGQMIEGDLCVVPEWCSTCHGRGWVADGQYANRCSSCKGKKIAQ